MENQSETGKENLCENAILGELMTQGKYRFVDPRIIAEVVRDVIKMQERT